ncbi:MAG TPA: FKBP-type peptidyl-prolyl cis-trans isomerase [Candidatus Paceibacterota bacterium]|nr:FKBP-type peptidyl-prolyl cis-trans isomerase [Candidatus Paceibacterota bacterium]
MTRADVLSHVKIEDVKIGTGREAGVGDTVVVNYTGYLTDGTKFDSSYDRKQPLTITLGKGQVIPGWDVGVQGMKVGGVRKLTIDPSVAYGPRGAGPIPPNSTLLFTVEMVSITPPVSAKS